MLFKNYYFDLISKLIHLEADFVNTFNDDERVFFIFNEDVAIEDTSVGIRPIKVL